MWESIGKVLQDFMHLKTIYLALDIDKYHNIVTRPVSPSGFVPGSTGLIQTSSSTGPGMKLSQDATSREILWGVFSEAGRMNKSFWKWELGQRSKLFSGRNKATGQV